MLSRLNSITSKFFLVLIPAIIATALLFLSTYTYLKYNDLNKALSEKVLHITSLHADAVAEPLWTFNNENVTQSLKTILTHPEVTCVEVQEPSGRYMDSWPEENCTDSFGEELVHSEKLIHHGQTVGIMHLYYSKGPIYQELKRDIGLAAFLLILTLATASLAAFIALSLIVGNPLEKFLRTIQESKSGNMHTLVQLNSNDELGRVVNEYNNLVALEREHINELENAREKAETATRTKSQFLATMSHELRTPLNAVIGISEMLLEDAEDNKDEEYIEPLSRVSRAGKHLLSLINEILDLSKIEAGKMDLIPEHIQLNDFMEDIYYTSLALAEKKGNKIVLDYHSNLKNIYADPTRLRQIILNLVSNACKFTEKGKVTVSVDNKEIEGTDWFEFKVTDNGIGMEQEITDSLFEEFTQADNTTTRKFGGTGLGLAICRRLCDMMGGSIQVNSEVDVGTVFTFLLPSIGRAQYSNQK